MPGTANTWRKRIEQGVGRNEHVEEVYLHRDGS
jgi:hypothetical protein